MNNMDMKKTKNKQEGIYSKNPKGTFSEKKPDYLLRNTKESDVKKDAIENKELVERIRNEGSFLFVSKNFSN